LLITFKTEKNGIYRADYGLEDAAQDESTGVASSVLRQLLDPSVLPASAGLAHAVCKN